jgi:hypothetical protein
MASDEGQVAYAKGEIIHILRDFEAIVVSLDHIGSATASTGRAEQDQILADFIRDWAVFRRLAAARKFLSAPFPDALGDDGMDELERAMQDVPCWELGARLPSEQ